MVYSKDIFTPCLCMHVPRRPPLLPARHLMRQEAVGGNIGQKLQKNSSRYLYPKKVPKNLTLFGLKVPKIPKTFKKSLKPNRNLVTFENQTVGIFGAKMMLGLKNEKSLLSSFLRLLDESYYSTPYLRSPPLECMQIRGNMVLCVRI